MVRKMAWQIASNNAEGPTVSKARDRLTAVHIKNLSKPGFYHDGGGLYLQISRFGSKSWILRYTLNQKKRDMGLGPLTDWTLAEAR